MTCVAQCESRYCETEPSKNVPTPVREKVKEKKKSDQRNLRTCLAETTDNHVVVRLAEAGETIANVARFEQLSADTHCARLGQHRVGRLECP